jgi:hypothetical protein
MFAVIKPNTPFSSEAFTVFNQSLGVTLKAMIGIFVVILIFYIIIILLGKLTAQKQV